MRQEAEEGGKGKGEWERENHRLRGSSLNGVRIIINRERRKREVNGERGSLDRLKMKV